MSGESYAGIYVPYLAQRIDAYNTEQTDPKVYKPNLKGFIVGNGVTNWKYDTVPAYLEMGYWHGLIDDVLYASLTDPACNFTYLQF